MSERPASSGYVSDHNIQRKFIKTLNNVKIILDDITILDSKEILCI